MAGVEANIILNAAGSQTDNNKAVLEVNSRWPHSARMDGWVLSHNALRRDMNDIKAAVKVLCKQVADGTPLAAWQISNLQQYWHHYYEFVEAHHRMEEQIFFPFVEKRARLPLLYSEEHGSLADGLRVCEAALTALAVTGDAQRDKQLLAALQGPFSELKEQMEGHFAEEEESGLPIYRSHFRFEETKQLTKSISDYFPPALSASFFHGMGRAACAEFCRINSIPWFVQVLVIQPSVRKFDRTLHKPLLKIINSKLSNGATKQKEPGCFGRVLDHGAR